MYNVGDMIRLSATFTSSGDYVDPTDPKFIYKKPDSTVVTKTYGTDIEVIKDAVGQYHMDVVLDMSGNWYYRSESSSVYQGAEEGEFYVNASNI